MIGGRVLDILAHCHDCHGFTSGPRYAAELAGLMAGSLTGLYVAPPFPKTPPFGASATQMAEFTAFVQGEIDAAEHAQAAFGAWAADFGIRRSHWQVALGWLPDVLASAANWNDIAVIEHRERIPRECLSMISSAVLMGMPCIVVRESPAPVSWDRIAIAWNGAPEAIRAVHSALPLLREAREVVVLASAPSAYASTSCEPDFSIESYLHHHGIGADFMPLESQRPADEAILLGSATARADLLVMGAFGTTRPHRDDASGITSSVIENAQLPILLRH